MKEITDSQFDLQLFAGYTEADTAIFSEFVNPDAKPQAGFITDFLGSRIRTTSVWKEARTLDGQLLGIPVPADFHAEAIEWIGLLKAVRSASGAFIAMELGAGFGPWIIAGGVAARQRGIEYIRLYGVEADPAHFQFLLQHFIDNGFDPDRHFLYEAAVGTTDGVAQWPAAEEIPASDQWGCRPVHDGQDYMGRKVAATVDVRIRAMGELIRNEPRWDLLHIDVQGDEVKICHSCIDDLSSRVRWIVAATHSRKLDGDFLELMTNAGWVLEHEKPAKFTFRTGIRALEALTTVDGTQVWRNPRFFSAGVTLTSFGQQISCSSPPEEMSAGETVSMSIVVENTGIEAWYGNLQQAPVNLGYRWFGSDSGLLPIEGDRAALGQSCVSPGERITLALRVVAPPKKGSYKLSISMVQEGVAWFYSKGAEPLDLQIEVR